MLLIELLLCFARPCLIAELVNNQMNGAARSYLYLTWNICLRQFYKANSFKRLLTNIFVNITIT